MGCNTDLKAFFSISRATYLRQCRVVTLTEGRKLSFFLKCAHRNFCGTVILTITAFWEAPCFTVLAFFLKVFIGEEAKIGYKMGFGKQ